MFRITMKKFHMWLSRKVLFCVEIGLCRTNVTFSDAKVPENEIRYITGFHFWLKTKSGTLPDFIFGYKTTVTRKDLELGTLRYSLKTVNFLAQGCMHARAT